MSRDSVFKLELFCGVPVWSAATCRRFESADESAHSKFCFTSRIAREGCQVNGNAARQSNSVLLIREL